MEQEYDTPHPATRQQRYFTLDNTDIWVATAAAAAWMLINRFAGNFVSYVFIGCIAMLFARPEFTGGVRIYIAAAQLVLNGWIKYVRKDVLWKADGGKLARLRGYVIPLVAYGLGDMGLIYNSRKRTDSIVVIGSGSTINAQNIRAQFGTNAMMADAIRQVASVQRLSVGTSFLHLRRPASLNALGSFLDRTLHPQVALPSGLLKLRDGEPLTDFDRRMMQLTQINEGVHDIVLDKAKQTVMAWVITLKRPASLNAAARKAAKKGAAAAGIAQREAYRLPIKQVADSAVMSLAACGVQDPRVLTGDEIATLLRMGYDCTNMLAYYDEHDPIDPALIPVATSEEGVTSFSDHWPVKEIRVGHDFVKTDDTYHATLEVIGIPILLYPHEGRVTYGARVPWYAQSLVGSAIRGGLEYTALNRADSVIDTLRDMFGYDNGPKYDLRKQSRQDRLLTIARSRFTQSYNIYACVSATNLDDLEDRYRTVKRHFVAGNFTIRRVTGRCNQLPAFLSATTGIEVL